MTVDGAIVKLSAKDILVLMQALRIAEEADLLEYCNRAYLNQLREKLSNAK